jgi:aconitate hydratase
VRANYLASPPLVVAYALAGTMTLDLTREPLGRGKSGEDVYLRDIWPSSQEIQETMVKAVTADMFREQYADVFSGDKRWQTLDVPTGDRFAWEPDSTYVRNPPFFDDITMEPAPLKDIAGGRALAILGDSITTDHISPAGNIKKDSPAGKYLVEHGVQPVDFNSYGARRGNHEVMMRGTFANTRLKNQLAPGTEGGWTTYQPNGGVMAIYDAAMKYKASGVPLVIFAGKEYGSGSSRDWAAKGTALLGVKAVIAESFERIHRSNLVNMGVLPLQFEGGHNAASLGLTGREQYEIAGLAEGLEPGALVTVRARGDEGKTIEFRGIARIDTPEELVAFKHGGILPYVLRQLVGGMANG